MSDAPERIWAAPAFFNNQYTYSGGSWLARVPTEWNHVTEYVRADRIAALEAEVARLREAFVWCADAPLTETERLLGKSEPEMKHDMDAWMNSAPRHYRATLDAARAALAPRTGEG